MKQLDKITPLEQDFSRWYTDVVTQGNLIEYGASQGSMIFKPISYGMWENIQKELNIRFKALGVQNVYLPLLIPASYISREKEHIKGFAPELATVTRVGDEELSEPLVIRPTSEVLFGELFSKEINSYNDLPILYNQWSNVLRWEKKTNPFLRNREFLWQEGHTAHASSTEALEFSKKMIEIYADFCAKFLSLPVLIGQKTDHEKFAGAETTFTIEAMMKDGRALQSGTSHYLGQNFAKSFNVQFKNKANEFEYVYQTSWGLSTRVIGALIMSHGDNRGIIIPPKVAPFQVDILELFASKSPVVKEASTKIVNSLKDEFRIRVDATDKQPGFKAGKSEIEGTPLRIEIGPRDLEHNKVTIVRRDTLEKIAVAVEDVKESVKKLLENIQADLYNAALKRLKENIVEAKTYDELKKLIEQRKFVLIPFEGRAEEEKKIKDETGATTRCIPNDFITDKEHICFMTGKKTKRLVIFARAY